MIERKEKKCKHCGSMRFIFGRGLCQYCYNIELAKKTPKKKRKRIKPISDKYKILLKKYAPKRAKFLSLRPFCEARLNDCTGRSEVVHHKKGKHSEELYLNEEFWVATCSSCNLAIERIGERAYELGLKIRKSKNE